MQRWHPRRTTKIEVLELMAEKKIISWRDLTEYSGYPYHSAAARLWRPEKEDLVSKLVVVRGKWVLTEAGYRRLAYYRQLE
jgi:hypothetical protein